MHIYAIEENTGKKHLVAIACDYCDARIKPNPDIAKSGWMRHGVYHGPGNPANTQWDACPDCALGLGLGLA